MADDMRAILDRQKTAHLRDGPANVEQRIDHDRPLGLYYFGDDEGEREQVLTGTTSGGVTVNDVVFHVAQEDLPFGGVGPSGMGSYHGFDGFKEFSQKKAIYTQLKKDLPQLKALRPPYGGAIRKYLAAAITR